MKRKKTWLYVCLTLLMLALTPAAVYGEEPDGDTSGQDPCPLFLCTGRRTGGRPVPPEGHKCVLHNKRRHCRNLCHQTYANEGTIPINASYVFPASARVTVHGMKMEIGNEVITAKIKEREEAKTELRKLKAKEKRLPCWSSSVPMYLP